MENSDFSKPPATLDELIGRLPRSFAEAEIQMIRNAYDLAAEAHAAIPRASGEPYIIHPLAVAGILADLRLDATAIAAGLLHDVVEDSDITVATLAERFNPKVASLVDGVTKLEEIKRFSEDNESQQVATNPKLRSRRDETLRKLFLAMAEDIRVVIIKLADRLHNVRTLEHLKEHKRRRITRETLEIYTPLANRLGIWQIKWQLEDEAFRWLEPAGLQAHLGRVSATSRRRTCPVHRRGGRNPGKRASTDTTSPHRLRAVPAHLQHLPQDAAQRC